MDAAALKLRDAIAETMRADPGLIEDVMETALAHAGRPVCVAVGDADSVTIQFWRQRAWYGLPKPGGAHGWKVSMELHK